LYNSGLWRKVFLACIILQVIFDQKIVSFRILFFSIHFAGPIVWKSFTQELFSNKHNYSYNGHSWIKIQNLFGDNRQLWQLPFLGSNISCLQSCLTSDRWSWHVANDKCKLSIHYGLIVQILGFSTDNFTIFTFHFFFNQIKTIRSMNVRTH